VSFLVVRFTNSCLTLDLRFPPRVVDVAEILEVTQSYYPDRATFLKKAPLCSEAFRSGTIRSSYYIGDFLHTCPLRVLLIPV